MKSRFFVATALVCLAFSAVACSDPAIVAHHEDETGIRQPTHGPIEYVPGEGPSQPTQTARPDAGGDTSSPKDGGSDAPEAAACNATVLPAAGVPLISIADNPPAAVGGAIADGHYVLVESRMHAGPGANEGSVTIGTAWAFDIAGATWNAAQITSDGSALRTTSKVTTSGANGTATCECGSACPLTTFQFTADANGLHMFQQGGFEEIFEKK